MKLISIFFFPACLLSCTNNSQIIADKKTIRSDSIELIKMIETREHAMITKELDVAISQFSPDITWINSQGYFFEGIREVQKFHQMLAENDSLDYYYEAGVPRIRMLDTDNGIAYYSWKMFWFDRLNPTDTVKKEIGLMTLTAKKMEGNWKWVAVTNQHTPWFYDSIDPVKIE